LYDGPSGGEGERELFMSEIKGYEFMESESESITCDYCNEISNKWYSDLTHAICRACLIHKIVIGERESV
jgi:hypothetical protein